MANELEVRWQTAAAEQALMAGVLGDAKTAERSIADLFERAGSSGLFNAAFAWATVVVGSICTNVPGEPALELEMEPVFGTGVDEETLSLAGAFLSGVAHDDVEGALLLWESMDEERQLETSGLLLGVAAAAYRPGLTSAA